MMCDILLCSNKATFGQPEITLGILPGAGGTQRLTHLVGKARAMDLVLTGRFVKAEEAEKIGLVSRLVPGSGQEVIEEAIKVATKISEFGGVAVQAAKEAVNSGAWSDFLACFGQIADFPLTQPRNCLFRKAFVSNGACSRACSRQRTRRRAWQPLPRSVPRTSRTCK